MKNQYVGDVGDFIKYAFLRRVSAAVPPTCPLHVVWYLTAATSHQASEGEKRKRPGAAHFYPLDQALVRTFEILRKTRREDRSVENVDRLRVLERATFDTRIVPQGEPFGEGARQTWFDAVMRTLEERHKGQPSVVFLDPDTALEPPSGVPKAKYAEYVAESEVAALTDAGHAVLIYHHIPPFHRKLEKWRALFEEREARLRDAAAGQNLQVELAAFDAGPVHIGFWVVSPSTFAHDVALHDAAARAIADWHQTLEAEPVESERVHYLTRESPPRDARVRPGQRN